MCIIICNPDAKPKRTSEKYLNQNMQSNTTFVTLIHILHYENNKILLSDSIVQKN